MLIISICKTILSEILSAINKATVRFKDRTLGGLGLSVSRWLQPPIASYDVYSGLTEVIERHAGVKVYRDNLINSRAYQMGAVSGRRNLAIIHPGNVIELGVLKDGRTLTSPYVTAKALIENMKREYALNGINEGLPDLYSTSTPDNQVINRIAVQTGKYLARACEHIADSYQPEIIYLMVPDNDLYKKTLGYYKSKTGVSVEITILPSGLDEVVAGTTAMAAFFSATQFIKVKKNSNE